MNRKVKLSGCILASAMLMSSFSAIVPGTGFSFFNSSELVVNAAESSVVFISSKGCAESAYAQWAPVTGATGYNVYCDGTQIDSMLIRQYTGYFRADAVGLKAGNHTLKVVPVFSGKEDTAKAASANVSVTSYDREGFCFSKSSVTGGSGLGAYNDDGTLKSDAVVLYLTEATKNTVTMKVRTGSSAYTDCTGIGEILKAMQKGYETRPVAIRIIGQVTASGVTTSGDTNNLLLKASSTSSPIQNITVEGIGEDATCYGWGIRCNRARSIEIRNVAVMLFGDDGIALETDNYNIWVHNNDIFYGTAGSDADQAKGDGSMDLKNDSKYITISYNHFWDSGKMSLCGMKSETGENFITYHHNWFDHSDSRHPRIRTMSVHVYNNYYDGNSKYGVGVTCGGCAFVESNYFRNCPSPMMISLQGTDALGEGTFSGENGGVIKSYGNFMTGQKSYITYAQNNTSFDAYEVTDPKTAVPSNVKALVGGTAYTNFDTKSDMYLYTPDAAKDVPVVVTQNAGRVNGGDFKFAFTEADDSSYAINTALMNAIKAYKTSVKAIGSGFTADSSPVPEQTTTAATTTTQAGQTQPANTTTTPAVTGNTGSAAVHNFTTDGASSSVFTIAGSISTDKGDLSYNGMTLSKCLKIDSAGSIGFTTSGPATVTIAAKSKAEGGSLKVNGAAQSGLSGISAAGGAYTFSVSQAGTYTITKNVNENYIYYISVSGGASQPSVTTTVPAATTPGANTTTTAIVTSSIVNPIASDTIFCSPQASASGAGTFSDPTSVENAVNSVKAGGVIWLKGGKYSFSQTLKISEANSGKSGAYKTIAAVPGEKAVFDFSSMSVDPSNRGISMEASWWHWYGVQIQYAGDNGMILSGSNNIIEMCVFNNNQDTGLQISRTNTSYADISQWPTNNLIKNCTAMNNCDDATMENADGFAAKLTCGEGNVFEGCMSYNNSDDGWDLYAKDATGPIGKVTFRNCVSFRNGYTEDGRGYGDCDGNGFKLGGAGVGTAHTLNNCVSFENLHHGFTDNNNPLFGSLTNCTSVSNSVGGGKANFQMDRCTSGTFKSILSYAGTGNCGSDKFNGTASAAVFYNSSKYWKVDSATAVANSKAGTQISGPSDSDFVSVKAPAMGSDFHTIWRNSDGTINTHGFLEVASSSSFKGIGCDMSLFTQQTPTILPKYDAGAPVTTVTTTTAATTTTTPVKTTVTTTTTAAAATTTTQQSGQIMYGDLDGNKVVEMTDLTKLSLYLLGDTDLTDEQYKAADVTYDGNVGLADLSFLKQYIMMEKVVLGPQPE